MIDLAFERIGDSDVTERVKLDTLKLQIVNSKRRVRASHQSGRLPVETFGEIFKLLAATDITRVIVVSLVCRYWRAVALNTPSLWRTLVLTASDPAGKVKEWTKRSQGHVRELCIRAGFHTTNVRLSAALQSFPWDRLQICRLDQASAVAIQSILEDLSMTRVLSNLVELEATGLHAGRVMPKRIIRAKLPSLILRDIWLRWDDITTNELVSLVMTNSRIYAGGSLLSVLKANPMLEKVVLEFRDHTFRVGSMSSIPSFSLPHLTHLELAGVPGYVFHAITLPSLRVLRMARVTSADLLLGSFLHQGPVSLVELRIQSSSITSIMLIALLAVASSLETLELSNVDGRATTAVEALTIVPSHTTLVCPSLTHIIFSACPGLQAGGLIRLVNSRLPKPQLDSAIASEVDTSTVVQIETLVLDKCPDIEPEILTSLKGKVKSVSFVHATKR